MYVLSNLLAIFIIIGISTATTKGEHSPERRLFDYLTEDYQPAVRPSTTEDMISGSPSATHVHLTFELVHLLDIVEKSQTATVVYNLDYDWIDPSLTWYPDEYENITRIFLPQEKLWVPQVLAENRISSLASPDVHFPLVEVSYDGTVWISTKVSVNIYCGLNMVEYPFDSHICDIKLSNWVYPDDQVTYTNTTASFSENFEENSEFSVFEISATFGEHIYSDENQTDYYPYVEVHIAFKRHPHFVIWTMLIPMMFLSLVSCASFLLPPESSDKANIQMSVMLSFAVFMLLIGDNMPSSKELPKIGLFSALLLVLNCVGLIASLIIVGTINTREDMPSDRLLRAMDRLGRLMCLHRTIPDVAGVIQQELMMIPNCPALQDRRQSAVRQEMLTSKYSGRNSSAPSPFSCSEIKLIAGYIKDVQEGEIMTKTWLYVGAVLDRICFFLLFITLIALCIGFWV